jgi:virulence-associated protein VagC
MSRPERAKLFRHGGSQAVRLPKRYRFDEQSEVFIRREGERVILEPIPERFSTRFVELAGSAPDFPYPEPATDPDPGPRFD